MTQQEELQFLRALVEKQKEQLAEKERIIEKQNIQIENMIQALLHARKKIFGASTETTKQVEGQMCLFESVQELAKQLGVEQKKTTVKPYTRVARQAGVREEMLAGLPKEVVEFVLPPEETCQVCGGELKVIGRRFVRTEVEYQPAKLIVKQIVREVAKCTKCGEEGSAHTTAHFQQATVPTPPLAHSISTPSLLAQIMYQKFVQGVPLARQEKDWYRLGLVLSRKEMSHWIIRCSEEWFRPVYLNIHEKLKTCGVLQ